MNIPKPDKIIHTKRTTIEFTIDENGYFIVRAPLKAKKEYIDELILKKSKWINSKLQKIRNKKPLEKKFEIGEIFMFLGEEYELIHSKILNNPQLPNTFELFAKQENIITQNKRTSKAIDVFFDGNNFIVSDEDPRNIRKQFIIFYLEQAEKIFYQNMLYYSEKMNLRFRQCKLSNAHKRWGSCSATGNINLCWRLIMAPLEVINYVIIHELGHLKHPNHSTKYWEFISRFCPDYKVHINWLKENGYKLTF